MTVSDAKDVLIVDDDEAIRGMLVAALARLGVSCDTAADGADALERVATARYSVVLLDLMMPRMDGGAFAAALRQRERTSAERPVVLMMTAFPAREQAPEVRSNVEAIIQKPFDVFELAGLVSDCVAGRKQYESQSLPAEAAPPEPPAIAPVLHARPEET